MRYIQFSLYALFLITQISFIMQACTNEQSCAIFITDKNESIKVPLHLVQQCEIVKFFAEDFSSSNCNNIPIKLVHNDLESIQHVVSTLQKAHIINSKQKHSELTQQHLEDYMYWIKKSEIIRLNQNLDALLFKDNNVKKCISNALAVNIIHTQPVHINNQFNDIAHTDAFQTALKTVIAHKHLDTELIQPYINTLTSTTYPPSTKTIFQWMCDGISKTFSLNKTYENIHYLNQQTNTLIEVTMNGSYEEEWNATCAKLTCYRNKQQLWRKPIPYIKSIENIIANNDESLFICSIVDINGLHCTLIFNPQEVYPIALDTIHCVVTANNLFAYIIKDQQLMRYDIKNKKTNLCNYDHVSFTGIEKSEMTNLLFEGLKTNNNNSAMAIFTNNKIFINNIINEKATLLSCLHLTNETSYFTEVCFHPTTTELYILSRETPLTNDNKSSNKYKIYSHDYNKESITTTLYQFDSKATCHTLAFVSDDILLCTSPFEDSDLFINIKTGSSWTKKRPRRIAFTTDYKKSIDDVRTYEKSTEHRELLISTLIDDPICNTISELNNKDISLALLHIMQKDKREVILDSENYKQYKNNFSNDFKKIVAASRFITDDSCKSKLFTALHSMYQIIKTPLQWCAVFTGTLGMYTVLHYLKPDITSRESEALITVFSGLIWLAGKTAHHYQ
jgi:hypothetical protein